MGQLVLLVVAAAWAAVLIPPMLRSRVENRPNSSVTDFRRQLNKLQSTVPSRAAGPMRGMARPLAPSPLQRPAAAGRPGARVHSHTRPDHVRGTVPRHPGTAHRVAGPSRMHEASMRPRVHGERHRAAERAHDPRDHRQAHVHRVSPAAVQRRRRTNVLFVLALATVSTLFLAATTKSTVMLYGFVLSFLALCGYVYLLSQLRQRDSRRGWPDDWMHR
jgi:hypothetical protein